MSLYCQKKPFAKLSDRYENGALGSGCFLARLSRSSRQLYVAGG
jgi:hypothetical protein